MGGNAAEAHRAVLSGLLKPKRITKLSYWWLIRALPRTASLARCLRADSYRYGYRFLGRF